MNEVPTKTITAINEPIKPYGPGSYEKESIKQEIERLKSTQIEIPIIIGGEEIKTGNTGPFVSIDGRFSEHIFIKNSHKSAILM